MPTYRVAIERVRVEREIVKVEARSAAEAIRRADEFADSRKRTRNVTVVQTFEDDPNSTDEYTVVQLSQQ